MDTMDMHGHDHTNSITGTPEGDDLLLILPETQADGRQPSESIRGRQGDDVLTAIASNGPGQIHMYGGLGDDTINLGFSPIEQYSLGHHAGGGRLDGGSPGRDIFNFTGLDVVDDVVVGRLEDFDPSEDVIQIEGRTLDLDNLPGNVRIVESNGMHNDPGSDPQQWLLIDTGEGSLFYSLGGARIDMTGDGLNPDGTQERHFVLDATDFSQLRDVPFRDPVDYAPAGLTPAGGEVIEDVDRVPADVIEEIVGTSAGDLIAAGLNDDTVDAGGGDDRVWGGSGHDDLGGGPGADVIEGNPGDDRLFGQVGDDRLFGGDGDDLLVGGRDHDRLLGGGGEDVLRGGQGYDLLRGGGGNDFLDGDIGNDYLHGHSGDDVIDGGANADKLRGGRGEDIFRFEVGDGEDRVLDFQNGVDRLQMMGQDMADLDIRQQGSSTVVEYEGGSVELTGIMVSTIDQADFVFG